MNKLLFAAVLALSANVCAAAELEGVTVPDTVQVGGQELVLNGMGLREKFWVNVYIGALYLPQTVTEAESAINMEGPSRLVMHFVHDAPAQKIIDAWKEGFAANNEKAVVDGLAEQLETFYGFFAEDIKEGDIVLLDYVPGEGTTVTINDEVKGTVPSPEFNRALRAVWLGPKPPSEDLRAGLLGKE